MSEAAFPVLGAIFVLVVVLPASALLTKAALLLIERGAIGVTRGRGAAASSEDRGARYGARSASILGNLPLRHLLLSASSGVPLAWFFSAALHQVEPGSLGLSCLLGHETASRCLEPATFALILLGSVLWATSGLLCRPRVTESSSSDSAALRDRIERIVATRASLSGLRGRVMVTDDALDAATVGLLRPRVVVGVAFGARLTDAMLSAALAHEQEHVRAFDPLRYLVLDIALRVNPLGRSLLAPHVARWRHAREAHCDREAVLRGAGPLPLAQALLCAARIQHPRSPALGPDGLAILRLRVSLLLAFAERRPQPRGRDSLSSLPVALACLVVALLLPHQTGTAPLDVLHVGIESLLTSGGS